MRFRCERCIAFTPFITSPCELDVALSELLVGDPRVFAIDAVGDSAFTLIRRTAERLGVLFPEDEVPFSDTDASICGRLGQESGSKMKLSMGCNCNGIGAWFGEEECGSRWRGVGVLVSRFALVRDS